MKELDDILSGGGEAMPESPQANVAENPSEPAGEIQPEMGSAEPVGQAEAQTAEAERERRRGSGAQLDAAEERHRQELERTRKEAKEEARRMFAAEASRLKDAAVQEYLQKQPQQPDDAPDRIFTDPRALIREELAAVERARASEQQERDWAQQRFYAELHFGKDKVAQAEAAFNEAYNSGQMNAADVQAIASSPNKAAAAIQWHERQALLAEIGTDPAAYRAKVAAEEREKALAEINGGGQQQVKPAAVSPSNFTTGARNVGARSGPAWSGPSTIDDIFNRTRPSG